MRLKIRSSKEGINHLSYINVVMDGMKVRVMLGLNIVKLLSFL